MKKIVLVVAVVGLAMASCRKDRTCTCTSTSDAPGFVSSTEVTVYKDSRKRDAKIACQSYTGKMTAPVASPYSSGQNCELK